MKERCLKYKNLILTKLFLCLFVIDTASVEAEGRTYTGTEGSGHCELWSLDRVLGKSAACRRRAGKQSEKPITCRFKSSYPNEDDPELTMCVYERAGYKMEDLIISSEGGAPCTKEFLCKRQ